MKTEITITGFGGQGIVLAGRILGGAAAIGDDLHSTFVQSYGPEARGGACSAQVILSDGDIYYPYVRRSDVLVCMSQSGYEKFVESFDPGGILLVDEDLVKPKRDIPYAAVPATRMAEELGRVMMANIIMLGFFTAMTGLVSRKAMEDAVTGSVPKGTEEKNMTAFGKGYDYGLALLKSREKKAAGKTRPQP